MSRSPAARGCRNARLIKSQHWMKGSSPRAAPDALCPHNVTSQSPKGGVIFACFRTNGLVKGGVLGGYAECLASHGVGDAKSNE